MKIKEFAKKLYGSRIALVFIYGTPFALILHFTRNNQNEVSIAGSILGGVIFGIGMSIFQVNALKSRIKFAESVNFDKNKTFENYIDRDEVPSSKAEKVELIAYMDKKVHKVNATNDHFYSQKNSKLYTYIVLVLLFFLTLSLEKIRLLAFIYPVVIAISLYGEYRNKKMLQKIEVMREKLRM